MAVTPLPKTVREQLKLVKANEQMASDAVEVIRLDRVETEPVDWLWYPFIAKKKLTVLTGEEGIGKSWITCALASIVSNGWRFPHIAEKTDAGNVLFLALEDGLSDTLKPRLTAVYANQEKIFSVKNYFSFDEIGLLRFYNLIGELQPILVIIDPFFSYLPGGLNINLSTEIRPITSKLAEFAEEFNSAFLLVRHIGKSKGLGDPRSAGLGSIDLRAVCRSELLVGRDPDNRSQGAIVQTKNNLTEYGESVGYQILSGEFTFLAKTHLTAEKILSSAKTEDERAESSEAAAFLREALRDGERETVAIKKEASALGITEKTLRTARVKLGVEVYKRGNAWNGKQKYYWRLPITESTASE